MCMERDWGGRRMRRAEDGNDLREFAASRGLPFIATPLTPLAGAAFHHAIASGIAPLDEAASGYAFALSPGEAGRRALEGHDLTGRSDVVVMEAAAFRQMLRDHAREAILVEADGALDRARPGQSARQGLTWLQGLVLSGLAALIVGAGWISTALALATFALLAGPIFASLVVLRIGALIDAWEAPPIPETPLPDARLPIYTILAPLHREAEIVGQLVAALSAMDYPPSKLDVKLLVEADDGATRAALAAMVLPPHFDVLVVPDGPPRTKPRALNVGLIEARGELLAIYDAEDRPDPRQLRIAANLFRRLPDQVACLQGRLAIDNADDGFLSRMFALEYAALFDVVNAGLIRAGLPVLLGGTSNHFRTRTLREVGGWDAWNVTEDADLAFRLVRSGYRIADLPSVTLEEAPARLRIWFGQRVRWMKGFLQTLATHSRQPLVTMKEAGWRQGICLFSLCAGTLLSMLSFPVFAIVTAVILLVKGLPEPAGAVGAALTGAWCALFLGGLIALMAPLVRGARHRGLGDLVWWVPLMPLYCLLVSAAAWTAIFEYLTAPHRWNKTRHGLARTSRLRRPPKEAPAPGGPLQAAAPAFSTRQRALPASGPSARAASLSAASAPIPAGATTTTSSAISANR